MSMLGKLFAEKAGEMVGESLATSGLSQTQEFMIATVDEVYNLNTLSRGTDVVVEESFNFIAPGVGSGIVAAGDVIEKHQVAIEALDKADIEGFENKIISVEGRDVEVWIDASNPENPIAYTDGNIVSRDIDPQDRHSFNKSLENQVKGLVSSAEEDVYNASQQNGHEGYLTKLEDYIEDKLQGDVIEKQSSLKMSPNEVTQVAEEPTINVNDPPPGFG